MVLALVRIFLLHDKEVEGIAWWDRASLPAIAHFYNRVTPSESINHLPKIPQFGDYVCNTRNLGNIQTTAISKWRSSDVLFGCAKEKPYSTSFKYHFTFAKKKGIYTIVRSFECKTIFVCFITVYCYHCSILLAVINLLLCLIYKFKFIMGMHM